MFSLNVAGTLCECDTVCRCCPMRCECRCEICVVLRRQNGGVDCDHCNGFVNAVMCGHIYEWMRKGVYPNLDFPQSNQPQQSTSGSGKKNIVKHTRYPKMLPDILKFLNGYH